jgi:hypothetical protein
MEEAKRVAKALLLGVTVVAGSAQQPNVDDALVELLVWGLYAVRSIDPAAYAPAVRAELEVHLRRASAYRSRRPVPVGSEMRMVHSAQVAYERRLVAVTGDAAAPSLAATYVDKLRPCYEWEGVHDCPEQEAIFADDYLAANPQSPFAAYLPLLAAHRWLCAAEGYDYEKRPEDAARSRREFEARVRIAAQSPNALIRAAAVRLAARGRCRADGRRAG